MSNITDPYLIPSLLWYTPPLPHLLLTLYTSFILLMGLLGNGLIVYGSYRHNAIKMEPISLLFLQNIALSDMCITLVNYLPMYVTLLCNRWVFGAGFCYFSAFFSWFVPTNNEMMIIAALSLYRLQILQKPKAYRESIPLHKVYFLMVLILVYSCAAGLIYIAAGNNTAHFYPEYLTCATSSYKQGHDSNHLNLITSIIFVLIPILIVITTNIAIISIFLRSRSNIEPCPTSAPGANLSVTLLCICCMFVLSYLPIVARDLLPVIEPWYMTFQIYVMSINVVINPIFFLVKHKEFRDFIKLLPARVFRGYESGSRRMSESYESNAVKKDSEFNQVCSLVTCFKKVKRQERRNIRYSIFKFFYEPNVL